MKGESVISAGPSKRPDLSTTDPEYPLMFTEKLGSRYRAMPTAASHEAAAKVLPAMPLEGKIKGCNSQIGIVDDRNKTRLADIRSNRIDVFDQLSLFTLP